MTKRSSILAEIVTRLKTIDGTGNFIFDVGSRVDEILESPDVTQYDFTTYPRILISWSVTDVSYEFSSRVRETLSVEILGVFSTKLSTAQASDFISDVFFALGSDLKFGGLANFGVIVNTAGRWLEEDTLTEVIVFLSVEFYRQGDER